MTEVRTESEKDIKADFEITQKYKQLLKSSGCQQSALVIDIEGVLYPYKFSADRRTGKLSFLEAPITVQNSRDSNSKARALDANFRAIQIMSALCEADPQMLVVPGSQLNLGRADVISKIDPIYHSAIDGAEAMMRGLVKRDESRVKSLTPTSDEEKIPAETLLIIVNDRKEADGSPPKTITNAIRSLPAVESLKFVQVLVPQFLFDIEDKNAYAQQLEASFLDTFSSEALNIPALVKTSHPFPSYSSLPPRKNIRRPGD